MKKRILLLLLVLAMLLCGCRFGSETDATESPKTASLVIIAGKHANSYNFSEDMMQKAEELIRESIIYGKEGKYTLTAKLDVTLIVCDGNPRVEKLTVGNSTSLSTSADNETVFQENLEGLIRAVCNQLTSDEVRAQEPGVDMQGALNQARKVLQVSNAGVKRILILDTGISTENHLDMRKLDILNGSAEEVIGRIDPDTFPNLDGIFVTFLGLGNVAGPQDGFGNNQSDEDALIEFWTTYLEDKCNARLQEPIAYTYAQEGQILSYSEDVENPYPFVPVVNFYPNKETDSSDGEGTGVIFKLPNAEIGFNYSADTFRDEKLAMEVLKGCAEDLRNYLEIDPDAKIYIVGSVARYHDNEDIVHNAEVSRKRAQRIYNILVQDFGFDPSLFVVIDAGSQPFSWRDAPEDDAHRELNRIVVLFPDKSVSMVEELRKAGEIE